MKAYLLKKNMFAYLFLISIGIITLLFFCLSIETYYDDSNSSKTTTTTSSYQTKETNNKKETKQIISYTSISGLNELQYYLSNSDSAGITSPLIVVGNDGTYLVNGLDTGIKSTSKDYTKPTILFIENTKTESIDKEKVKTYTILYSNGETKEFKLYEDNVIESTTEIDIDISEDGFWLINGENTHISAITSGYDSFINKTKSYQKAYEEWLKEIKNGSFNISLLNQYTCVFYPENGSIPFSASIYESRYLSSPVNPEKEGYRFIGWYLDNKLFNFEQTPITSNIVLVAQYKREDYKLIINKNNSALNNEIRMIHYGDKINLPSMNAKNLVFEGWIDENDEPFNLDFYSVTKDTTLVAKWGLSSAIKYANSDFDFCNKSYAIKDATTSSGWYCDDMPVLCPSGQAEIGVISFLDSSYRASGEETVINDFLKLDIVGETKSKKTAMIQDLDYESEPRYYVRT